MFGYRGFGKGRFARGVGSYTGIQFQPAHVTITYSGFAPSFTYHFPPVRITQTAAEVWIGGSGGAGESPVRVSQIGAEIYHTLENARVRMTAVAAEIWVTIALKGDDESVSIIW